MPSSLTSARKIFHAFLERSSGLSLGRSEGFGWLWGVSGAEGTEDKSDERRGVSVSLGEGFGLLRCLRFERFFDS